MLEKEMLRKQLLGTGYFLDNEWLDKYLNLVELNKDTERVKFKTHRHHILPKYISKLLKQEADNSADNIVNLLFSDHALAHYYLCLASIDNYGIYCNTLSIQHICNLDESRFINISEEWLINNLPSLGELREIMLEENSKMLSEKMSGENNPFYGKKHTVESKLKMSIGCKKSMTPERRALMSEFGKQRDNSKQVAAMAYYNKNFRDYSQQGAKISATKKRNGTGNNHENKIHLLDITGTHKTKSTYITEDKLDEYLSKGWIIYPTQEQRDIDYHNQINSMGLYNLKYWYVYNNKIYSLPQVVNKLREDGYDIYTKSVIKIVKGTSVKFSNLIGKITKVKPSIDLFYTYYNQED